MRERRKNFRVEWNSPAKIYDRNDRSIQPCIVRNFSNGGARIVGIVSKTVPDEFILRLSSRGGSHRCRVTWRSKDGIGVKFIDDAKSDSEPAGRARANAK